MRDLTEQFMKGMGFDPGRYIAARVGEFRQTFILTRGDDSGGLSDELEATLVAIEEGLRESLPAIKDKLAALYEQHFTESEMIELSNFWQSETYKKSNALQESLTEAQGVIMGEWNTNAYNHAEPQMKAALDTSPPSEEITPVDLPPADESLVNLKRNMRVIEMPPAPEGGDYLTADEIATLDKMSTEDPPPPAGDTPEVLAGEEPDPSAA